MIERYVLGTSARGFHRVAYTVWGEAGVTRTVVCVHGLTGNGSDFEELAPVLVRAGYRVVCPDVVGRGASDRLTDPAGYALPQYVGDMSVLLGRLDVQEVDWIGTSMGGLIGMAMASMSATPIRRLVLNDIGPFIPVAALERLASYVGSDPVFDRVESVEAYLRDVRAPFGPLADLQWRRMAERMSRPRTSGGFELHHDPGIGVNFHVAPLTDVDMWAQWDAIECPVLLLRGRDSDLLLRETAREMTERGPGASLVEFAGVGHAPALLAADQIGAIVDWLG